MIAPPRSALPRPHDRLKVGATSVSPYCIGIVADPAVISAAFDAGINFFFVSTDLHYPVYRHTREGLSALFRSRPSARKDVVVALTSYISQADWFRRPFEETIDDVAGLAYADMLIAGGCDAQNSLGRIERLHQYRDAEFVGTRAIGASFHDRSVATLAVNQNLLDLALVRYNAAQTGARRDIFDALRNADRSRLFGFKSTASRMSVRAMARALATMAETTFGGRIPTVPDHYRFALSRPELDGILCAPQTLDELDQLLRATESGGLSSDEEQDLMALVQRVIAQGP